MGRCFDATVPVQRPFAILLNQLKHFNGLIWHMIDYGQLMAPIVSLIDINPMWREDKTASSAISTPPHVIS